MDTTEIQQLKENYHRRISKVDTSFVRYLYNKINWNARLIGIKGARGVGKTTMLFQHILNNYADIDEVLYMSLDDLWFSTHSLLDVVDWVYQHGLKRLYIDEVHRYPNWAQTIKHIYDNYPDLSIIYTGSSLLSIEYANADLARRQTVYTLHGLSFREFLELESGIAIPPIPFNELLKNHLTKSLSIIRQTQVANYFEHYLEYGYYPYYREAGADYLDRLRLTTTIVIENDLPAVEDISFETIQKVKRLLMLLGEHVPFVPNMAALWRELSTNNDLGLKMLYSLDRAEILSLVTSQAKNYKHLSKPEKIFLGNTNLMHAICPSVNKGGERETFFFNQLSVNHNVSIPKYGDFLVDGKYLFEVGGKSKTFEQIHDIPDSFLAVDDTETGSGNRIPLWMFGLLY